MTLIAWLILMSGAYLTSTALANKNPRTTLLSLLQGKGIPAEVWYPLPIGSGALDGFGALGKSGSLPRDPGTTAGLAAGLAAAGPARQTVVQFAMAQLGEPYLWGASGPNRWDCSGLTMKAYEQVGIKLPHHAASQQQAGREVSAAQAQPGDLIFWNRVSGHVAIYLGGGQMIHAPHTGDVVRVANIYDTKHANFRSYV